MKRADMFKEFVASLRTYAESMYVLPDLPNGCDLDYLDKVLASKPIADNPYDPSLLRDNGLMLWDSVYLPAVSQVSLDPKSTKNLATLRAINDTWEATKESLTMIGRPDGVHYIRPKGDYILDTMSDDLRILQGAHIITHRNPSRLEENDYLFGQCADEFLRNIIKLFIARKYELPINVHPEHEANDAFSRFGIEVFGSTSLRAPTLLAAASGPSCRLLCDRTVITLLGSVGIEPHPKQAATSCSWKEINKWSCLPTLIALSGWECVDYVTHAERVELNECPYYAVPCSDLQPMSSFSEILSIAVKSRGLPELSDDMVLVKDWFESDDFKTGLASTPQLPCPFCLRLNQNVEGVIRRPRSVMPRRPFKEIENSTSRETKEWVDYVRFMRNCIEIGRKATTYAIGSVTEMKSRNREFKSLSEKRRRIFSLEERYVKKLSNGFITEAEEIARQINCLKDSMKELH